MKNLKAVLVVAEALLCFGAVGAFLAVGVMTSPVWLIAALTGEPAMFLAIVGGCIGGYGLLMLLVKIVVPEARAPSPWWIWLSIVVGFSSLVPTAMKFLNPDVLWLTVGAPVVATLHFIYLARGYLFKLRSDKEC